MMPFCARLRSREKTVAFAFTSNSDSEYRAIRDLFESIIVAWIQLRYKSMLKIARKREARLRIADCGFRIADFSSQIPHLQSAIIFAPRPKEVTPRTKR